MWTQRYQIVCDKQGAFSDCRYYLRPVSASSTVKTVDTLIGDMPVEIDVTNADEQVLTELALGNVLDDYWGLAVKLSDAGKRQVLDECVNRRAEQRVTALLPYMGELTISGIVIYG